MTSMLRKLSDCLDYALPVLLTLAALVPVATILLHQGGLPDYWQADVVSGLGYWVLVCVALALLLRLRVPRQAGIALVASIAIAIVLVTGVTAALSVLLFMLACTLAGVGTLKLFFRSRAAAGLLLPALFTGLALYLGLFAVMVHYPVNYRIVILALWLLPLAVTCVAGKFRSIPQTAVELARSCSASMQELPYPVLVLMAAVLGFVASHAFFPTMTSDDQTLHLRLWTELSWQHVAAFDFVTHVSAMTPLLVDLQHALVSLVAGTDARAALTLFWAALLLVQLWQLARRYLRHAASAALVVALFASTPMLGNLLLTLQTELFLALLASSAMTLVLSANMRWYSAESLALLAIAALCCGTKLPGAVLGLLLLVAACVHLHCSNIGSERPGPIQWRLLSGYLVLLAIPALNSYLNAWRMTGNPLFPYYNAVFHSPWFDSSRNFVDVRWTGNFSLKGYWDVFFTTSRHYESRDFVAGFQYLLLLPLAVLKAVTSPVRRHWLLMLIPLGGFGLMMFATLQYWRYLFPVLPLASLLLAVLLQPAPASAWCHRWASCLAFGTALVLNLYFYPGISWAFQLSPFDSISANQRKLLLEQYATPAAINQQLNDGSPGLRVLYPQEAEYGATLKGTPLYADWFSPTTLAKAARIMNAGDLTDFLHDEKVDAVIWSLRERMSAGSPKWLLGLYLSRHGSVEFQLANDIVYRLSQQELQYQPLFSLSAWSAQQPAPAVAVTATDTPLELAKITMPGARAARYTVSYNCGSAAGYFVAQLNWDKGPAYYRLLPCVNTEVTFSEAIPVPAGAQNAVIYLTARDRAALSVTALTVETL